MRIKIPKLNVRFIDAAHLIPFADEFNDHPSNGIALCKHHHWIMDRGLISPGPDLTWHVSHAFDARRSSAENELLALQGKDILLPKDEAFYPSQRALEYRFKKLVASSRDFGSMQASKARLNRSAKAQPSQRAQQADESYKQRAASEASKQAKARKHKP